MMAVTDDEGGPAGKSPEHQSFNGELHPGPDTLTGLCDQSVLGSGLCKSIRSGLGHQHVICKQRAMFCGFTFSMSPLPTTGQDTPPSS